MPPVIEFEPVGRRGNCSEGSTLLMCARELGVDLENLCGGAGTCGRCKVQVVSGDLLQPTSAEREYCTPVELAQGYRLACQTVPQSGCRVRTPPESLTAPQRTQVEGVEAPITPEPPVRAYAVEVPPPSLQDLRADAERLNSALRDQHGIAAAEADYALLRDLSACLRTAGWHVRAAVRGNELVAVQPAEPPRPGKLLGLAVDLGTTKIAAYLVDLETGATLASRGLMNPQIAFGEDVIARMAHAAATPDQAAQLQRLVVEALDAVAAEMGAEAGADPAAIVEAVVVGNTVMHHLLLRLPTDQLANAPYVPAVRSALEVKARELGLHLAPGAYVHLLPNIAGYVGADHVAMLLASGVHRLPGIVLALDIGTNTEVCLAVHGRLTSTSCASGPAFEGAHIRHGMRAAGGAIEHLRLAGGGSAGAVEYQTIGGVRPVGLCGSGILDTLAELHRTGIVDRRGKMHPHPRVCGSGAAAEFVIASEEEAGGGRRPVTFSQQDVREIQLAKGAIRAGIQVLLASAGLHHGQIDRVIIAGAFGTYVDVGSAVAVGMLPPLPLDRFVQVGNAAGIGAKMALISVSQRAEAQAIAARVGYVELAAVPTFSMTFAQSMLLGPDLF